MHAVLLHQRVCCVGVSALHSFYGRQHGPSFDVITESKQSHWSHSHLPLILSSFSCLPSLQLRRMMVRRLTRLVLRPRTLSWS